MELEHQIQEMLTNGVIRLSQSPFSSPLVMVKKKDATWRPVIDYKHLNAMTQKSKFPIPVIDELLNELFGVSWFTKLDLGPGYHQFHLAPGEEYKTAFQMHLSHYEFTILSLGLTGAPSTFQFSMNSTLSLGIHIYESLVSHSRTIYNISR